MCRERAAKKTLLRFVVGPQGPEFDEPHRAPGRGMYIHPRVQCWTRLSESSLWTRALRLTQGSIRSEQLREVMDVCQRMVPELNADPVVPRKRIRMI